MTDKRVTEAHKRFEECEQREAIARVRMMDDVRFGMGDDQNGYQWPDAFKRQREQESRPVLTINKARVHALQIINDARQNKSSVKIRAMGNGSTYESAEAYDEVVRHIEYISNAQDAYNNAFWWQVFGGIGYWHITRDWADKDAFHQEVFIRRIPNPFNVYLDPDIQQADGSDARFGFIFDDIPKDEFEATYPGVEAGGDTLGNSGWLSDKHVRVAEYYYREKVEETIYQDETGAVQVAKKGEVPEGAPSRKRERYRVKWCKIAGDKVIDEEDLPGSYIPIVRVVGEETVIDGQLDRRGHIRGLRDAQRMYNFYTSAYAETVALQPKAPFIAPLQAITGLETYWNTANKVSYAYLPYNAVDENGNIIPKPEREMPPPISEAHIKGLQVAQQELMMASGQYQAVMGEKSNETSGVAIEQRQRQGDNATYHYIDRQAQAIRFTGRILIEWIPEVYDTERLLHITAEDGESSQLAIDPQAPQAMMQVQQPGTEDILRIFNPNVGKYEVEADIGPAFATRRQEAFNAMVQIISQNKELVPLIGDLMFRAADFPMADDIAERLERAVPPQIKSDQKQPGPEQAQLAQAMQVIKMLQAELAQLKQDKSIDQYDAETRRMSAVGKIDPMAMKPVIRGKVSAALGTHIGPLMQAHAVLDQSMEPPPPPMPAGQTPGQ